MEGPPRVRDAGAWAGPGDLSIGIGGSYTLLPRGGVRAGVLYVQPPLTDLMAWPITTPIPTRIVLPVGTPVRVVASDSVVRTPDYLTTYCAQVGHPVYCTGWLRNGPVVHPWGIRPIESSLGLTAAWSPGGPVHPSRDSTFEIMRGPVPGDGGGELRVGRDGCCGSYVVLPSGAYVPFYRYSGRWTVTVQADDGSDSLFRNPKIWLDAPSTRPAPAGPVTARLQALSGQQPQGIRWYYVPDAIGVFTGDPPAAPPAPAPAPPPELRECANSTSCTIAPTQAGSFLAVARLSDGRVYSASNSRPVPARAATLVLDCPATTRRGDEARCVASADPGTAQLEITGWRFQPDLAALGEIVRADDIAAVDWAGPVATSGTVTVSAMVNGIPKTASARIVVTDRDWSDKRPRVQLIYEADHEDLIMPPRRRHDLGHTDMGLEIVPTARSVATASSGPNAGLTYLTDLPVEISARVHINEAALVEHGELWRLQPNKQRQGAGAASCTKADLVPFLRFLRSHEGVSLEPGSHVRLYRDAVYAQAGAALEKAVHRADGADAFRDLLATSLQPVAHAARRASDGADDEDGWYCEFNFVR